MKETYSMQPAKWPRSGADLVWTDNSTLALWRPFPGLSVGDGTRRYVAAVFDCMIFLQGAARRESPAGICLLVVELGAVELYLSPEIINELRDVLTRPRLRVRFPALTDHLVNEFLKSLERQAVLIPDVPRIFSYERDPKDEPYINALAANATQPCESRQRCIGSRQAVKP